MFKARMLLVFVACGALVVAGTVGTALAGNAHVKETITHAKEAVAHEKEAITHLEEAVKSSTDAHAKEALEHAKEAVKHAEEALAHAEQAEKPQARLFRQGRAGPRSSPPLCPSPRSFLEALNRFRSRPFRSSVAWMCIG